MTKGQVLFIHGGGGEAFEGDEALARSLREALGPDFDVEYPEMPDADAPEFGAWSACISQELSALGAGVILIAIPYWGAVDWKVAEFELREDFPQALPKDVPIFLYHSRDDEVVPFAHLAMYAGRLPHATVREVEDRGHQLGDDLSEVAEDIARI